VLTFRATHKLASTFESASSRKLICDRLRSYTGCFFFPNRTISADPLSSQCLLDFIKVIIIASFVWLPSSTVITTSTRGVRRNAGRASGGARGPALIYKTRKKNTYSVAQWIN